MRHFLQIKKELYRAHQWAYDMPESDRFVLAFIIEQTYGYKRHWAKLTSAEIAQEVGMLAPNVRRSLNNLRKHNAIRRKGKGKRAGYEFGPQKFCQFWTYKLRVEKRPKIDPADDEKNFFHEAKNKADNVSQKIRKQGKLTYQSEQVNVSIETGYCISIDTLEAAQTPAATGPAGTLDKEIKRYTPLPPTGECGSFGESGNSVWETEIDPPTVVESASQAVALDLDLHQAIHEAEKVFTKELGHGLSVTSRRKLRERFQLLGKPNSCLALWIVAAKATKRERREQRLGQDPKNQPWRRPFEQALHHFGLVYEEKKAQAESRKPTSEEPGQHHQARGRPSHRPPVSQPRPETKEQHQWTDSTPSSKCG